jgi:hypothetical protein
MHIPARGHWQQQWDQTNAHPASGTDSPSHTSRLQQPSSTASLGALWVGVDDSWASRRRRRQINGGLAGGKLDEELGLTYSPVGQTSLQAATSWETHCDYLIHTAANTELPPTKYNHSCLNRPRYALVPKCQDMCKQHTLVLVGSHGQPDAQHQLHSVGGWPLTDDGGTTPNVGESAAMPGLQGLGSA